MGRIRTIKPEFPQSETIGRLSRDARLLFLQLLTIADDDGRMRGANRLLATQLYPYDDDAVALIETWLTELVRESMIVRYEVDGNTYLQIWNWAKHQRVERRTPSKIPEYSAANSKGFTESSLTTQREITEASPPPHQQITAASPTTHGVLTEASPTDLGSRILDLGSRTMDQCVLEDSPREAPPSGEQPRKPKSTHTRRPRESQEFFSPEFVPPSHRTEEFLGAWHSWLNYVLDRDGRLVQTAVEAWAMDAGRREPGVAAERLRESVTRLARAGPFWTEMTGSRAVASSARDPQAELESKIEAARQKLKQRSQEVIHARR